LVLLTGIAFLLKPTQQLTQEFFDEEGVEDGTFSRGVDANGLDRANYTLLLADESFERRDRDEDVDVDGTSFEMTHHGDPATNSLV